MGRRVAIYALLVAVLVGAGLVVSFLLFDRGEGGIEEGSERPAPVRERQPAPEVSTPDANEAGVADAAPDAGEVVVLGVSGEASLLSGGGGDWRRIESGERLAEEDAVRTERSARVELRVGDRSTVEVAEEAELRVREISRSVQRLGLMRGRVSVDYRDDGERVLRVESDDGSAVAETRGGSFSVLNTGETVAVATETGSVDFSAAGESVEVGAGEQSVAAGGSPSRPRAIASDVMLRVVDPGCRVQRETFIVIRGRTSPGSRVRANDTPAEVDASGRFAVRVPLEVGRNTIVVTTEDALGRSKRRRFPCVKVDPGAPIKKVEIEWGAPQGG